MVGIIQREIRSSTRNFFRRDATPPGPPDRPDFLESAERMLPRNSDLGKSWLQPLLRGLRREQEESSASSSDGDVRGGRMAPPRAASSSSSLPPAASSSEAAFEDLESRLWSRFGIVKPKPLKPSFRSSSNLGRPVLPYPNPLRSSSSESQRDEQELLQEFEPSSSSSSSVGDSDFPLRRGVRGLLFGMTTERVGAHEPKTQKKDAAGSEEEEEVRITELPPQSRRKRMWSLMKDAEERVFDLLDKKVRDHKELEESELPLIAVVGGYDYVQLYKPTSGGLVSAGKIYNPTRPHAIVPLLTSRTGTLPPVFVVETPSRSRRYSQCPDDVNFRPSSILLSSESLKGSLGMIHALTHRHIGKLAACEGGTAGLDSCLTQHHRPIVVSSGRESTSTWDEHATWVGVSDPMTGCSLGDAELKLCSSDDGALALRCVPQWNEILVTSWTNEKGFDFAGDFPAAALTKVDLEKLSSSVGMLTHSTYATDSRPHVDFFSSEMDRGLTLNSHCCGVDAIVLLHGQDLQVYSKDLLSKKMARFTRLPPIRMGCSLLAMPETHAIFCGDNCGCIEVFDLRRLDRTLPRICLMEQTKRGGRKFIQNAVKSISQLHVGSGARTSKNLMLATLDLYGLVIFREENGKILHVAPHAKKQQCHCVVGGHPPGSGRVTSDEILRWLCEDENTTPSLTISFVAQEKKCLSFASLHCLAGQ